MIHYSALHSNVASTVVATDETGPRDVIMFTGSPRRFEQAETVADALRAAYEAGQGDRGYQPPGEPIAVDDRRSYTPEADEARYDR